MQQGRDGRAEWDTPRTGVVDNQVVDKNQWKRSDNTEKKQQRSGSGEETAGKKQWRKKVVEMRWWCSDKATQKRQPRRVSKVKEVENRKQGRYGNTQERRQTINHGREVMAEKRQQRSDRRCGNTEKRQQRRYGTEEAAEKRQWRRGGRQSTAEKRRQRRQK